MIKHSRVFFVLGYTALTVIAMEWVHQTIGGFAFASVGAISTYIFFWHIMKHWMAHD